MPPFLVHPTLCVAVRDQKKVLLWNSGVKVEKACYLDDKRLKEKASKPSRRDAVSAVLCDLAMSCCALVLDHC